MAAFRSGFVGAPAQWRKSALCGSAFRAIL
jgi:hypothetical protein